MNLEGIMLNDISQSQRTDITWFHLGSHIIEVEGKTAVPGNREDNAMLNI